MTDKNPLILVSVDQGIAEIRFNRPDKLNALSYDLTFAFKQAVEQIVGREDVGVIILSAEGRAFISGGDLDYFRQADNRPAAAEALVSMAVDALSMLSVAPQIVISSLKGAVAGGGMGVALCADLIIASDDTRFSSAYAKIAMSPDCGMSWVLPRAIGVHRALEMVLLAEPFDAEKALEDGLVNRVVPRAELESETCKLAERIAAGGFVSNAHSKALIRGSASHNLETQLKAELQSFIACSGTGDFEEGLEAFKEKRPPKFTDLMSDHVDRA